MTNLEATKIVTVIASSYPVPAWSKDTMKAYINFIIDLDSDHVSRAAHEWVCSQPERPSVSDLRRGAARNAMRAGKIPKIHTPEEAWGYVLRCISLVGSAKPFPNTYPLIAKSVNAIGWETLCRSTNQMADRSHFWRIYSQMEKDAIRDVVSATGLVPKREVAELPKPKHVGLVGIAPGGSDFAGVAR